MTEKIKLSCSDFLLQRIHNEIFVKMPFSDYDKMALKVIEQRKEKMK